MRKIVGAANWPLPTANQNHKNLLGHAEKDGIATQSSLFTNLEQTPLNRSQQLPAPYKRLIDEIKHN